MDTELVEQTISAAMDGEAVDIDVLRRALATAHGRDALAGFVLLRAVTAADAVASAERNPALPAVGPSQMPSLRRAVLRYRVPATLAASLTALAVAGAFWLGSTWQTTELWVRLAPPSIAVPAVAVAPTPPTVEPAVVRPCPPPPAPQPPRPTRVVRYVRGVDWTDGTSQ